MNHHCEEEEATVKASLKVGRKTLRVVAMNKAPLSDVQEKKSHGRLVAVPLYRVNAQDVFVPYAG
jgi:hypothetical protein